MTVLKTNANSDVHIPPEVAQNYIAEMLEELSGVALASGMRDLASLLRLTIAAAKVDLELEIEP